MIIRQFLTWTQHSSAGRRAEAASALARAYLHGSLGPEAAWEAKTAMLALLDDPAPIVRRALAEACAASPDAPRPLVVALAGDQPDIASLVLARSPVLTDADLVDGAAIGCEAARAAIAGRPAVSPAVAGALAEIAGPGTLTILAGNPSAAITIGSQLRMVERHGGDGALREALLARPGLALEVRHAIAARLAQSLSAFATACGWLSPERGERATREARERTTLTLSEAAEATDMARLVVHLRRVGQLNAGLILRAILSGRMPFVEAALADLSGLSPARVAGLMHEAPGAGFAALHRRAGLPPVLLPAFTAALSAWREAASGETELSHAGLSRRMIERALTACETMPFAEAQSVMALLARFEAEAARDEARDVAKALADEAGRAEAAWHRSRRAIAFEEATREAGAGRGAGLPESGSPEVAAQDDASQAEAGSAEAIDAVLDGLPDAIFASYREEQERLREAAARAVLDTIPDIIMTSFRLDHEQMLASEAATLVGPIPEAIVADCAADGERLAA